MQAIKDFCKWCQSFYYTTPASSIQNEADPLVPELQAQNFIHSRSTPATTPGPSPRLSETLQSHYEIRTKQELDHFIVMVSRHAWTILDKPVRVKIYSSQLYDQLHEFFGTKKSKSFQKGASGRVHRLSQNEDFVMKRSSPRKLSTVEKRQRLRKVNQREFAFYQDIHKRKEEINKKSIGKPNFPQAKFLITLEELDLETLEPATTSYSLIMQDFGQDLLERTMQGPSMSFEEYAQALLHVLEALVWLQDAGYVHLDIKPENLSILGLYDFGYIRKCGQKGISANCGTRNYISPELFLLGLCNQKTDSWSLGAAFYLLYAKEYLFDINTSYSSEIGSFINHLWLIGKRLQKAPDEIMGLMRPEIQKKFFVFDASRETYYLKREFRFPLFGELPSGQTDPFTVEPFTEKSTANYLASEGFFYEEGKLYRVQESTLKKIEVSHEELLDHVAAWEQHEKNMFTPMSKRIKEVTMKKSKRADQEQINLQTKLVTDFLEKALEPNLSKRLTPKQLMQTDLIKYAQSLPSRRKTECKYPVKTSARQLF